MSIWTKARNWISSGAQEEKAVDFSPEFWAAINGAWGLPSKSGVTVSVNSSLMQMAFYRGVLVLADGVAQLPVELYRRTSSEKGAEPAIDHPLYEVLNHRANNLQDSFQFWRTMLMHTVATGDGVAFKTVVNGQVRELLPIRPECRSIDIQGHFNERSYDITFEKGAFATVGQSEVFHLQGPSWAAYRGLDPSVVGREAIGLSQATENSHSSLHRNGVRPSGTINTPKPLNKVQVAELAASWAQQYTGVDRVGSTPILSGGLEFKPMTQSGVDSEHLATRKHQIEEIARLLGVFPIMLGHAGDQSPTFASADAFLEAHVRYSLQPLFRAIISAVQTQLLTRDEVKAGYFCRIDSSELLRGSLKDRTEYYKAALGDNNRPGWLPPNAIREDDGWNPDPDPEMDKVWRPVAVSNVPKAEPKDEAKSIRPRSLYVCRKLLNAGDLIAWAKKQGLTGVMPADELHVTIAYSKQALDWMAVGTSFEDDVTVKAGGPRVVEPIGSSGAIALKFSSSILAWRNHEIIEAGASWDWDEYQPHVTLTYEKQTADITKIEPFRGELRFGPEIFEEIKDPAR